MSSVPYVPPDTMKNVATTSDQSLSFTDFLPEVKSWAASFVSRLGTLGPNNFYGRSLDLPGVRTARIVRSAFILTSLELRL